MYICPTLRCIYNIMYSWLIVYLHVRGAIAVPLSTVVRWWYCFVISSAYNAQVNRILWHYRCIWVCLSVITICMDCVNHDPHTDWHVYSQSPAISWLCILSSLTACLYLVAGIAELLSIWHVVDAGDVIDSSCALVIKLVGSMGCGFVSYAPLWCWMASAYMHATMYWTYWAPVNILQNGYLPNICIADTLCMLVGGEWGWVCGWVL